MDDDTSDHRHLSHKSTPLTTPNFQDGGDPAVWAAFTENFRQVQSVLDRNRVLIQQVNENHQSKIHDNLVKNVVSLYSNLSGNFSSVVHQQSAAGDGKSNSEEKQR
ncbi:hypothetical protein Pfo_027540 [Paulownia fortunei]|nr:hypothetical protein Pfo_027540 [Paulownia fortunei]